MKKRDDNSVNPSDDDNHNPPTTRNDNSLIHLPKCIPTRNNLIFTDDNPKLRRQRGGSPKTMNKKGLSQVIISLLLVGLALVITGILWAVIHNLAVKGTEDINLYNLKADLAVTLFEYDDDKEEWKIRIENRGEEIEGVEETGFRFVFHSEGESWDDIKIEKGLKPGAKSTFRFSRQNLTGGDGIISEVKVYPIIKKEGDKRERELNRYFKQKLDVKSQLKSLGAIAWWRFEGNARDEIGENDGEIIGEVKFTKGTYGRAIEDGDTGSLSTADDVKVLINKTFSSELKEATVSNFSMAFFWTPAIPTDQQPYSQSATWPVGISFGPRNNTRLAHRFNNSSLTAKSGYRMVIYRGANLSGNIGKERYLNNEEEYHFIITCGEGKGLTVYLNGKEEGKNLSLCNRRGIRNPDKIEFLIGNSRGTTIDEVMIFDRVLTKKEI